MKVFFIFICFCLALCKLEEYDETIIENDVFQTCPSNGEADVTIITSSPNQYFCYQESYFLVNATIISGLPIVIYYTAVSPYEVFSEFLPTGTNIEIGEYNTWNFSYTPYYSSYHCQPGYYNLSIYILDNDTSEISACMYFEYTIPSPSGNIGEIDENYYIWFNIYTIEILPYPYACNEENIIITGSAAFHVTNFTINHIAFVQNLGQTSTTYIYSFNDFNTTVLGINTFNIKVPAPKVCLPNEIYFNSICLLDTNIDITASCWKYQFTIISPSPKNNGGQQCSSLDGFLFTNIHIEPEIIACSAVTIDINGTIVSSDGINLTEINIRFYEENSISTATVLHFTGINTTIGSYNTYSFSLNPPAKCKEGVEYSYEIRVIDSKTLMSQACWDFDFKIPKKQASLAHFLVLNMLILNFII